MDPGADADADAFDETVRASPRLLVLYWASWCPFSRVFAPEFDRQEAECSVPAARAQLGAFGDARWHERGIRRTPTVVYYEHGEELERLEAAPHAGLTGDELSAFLDAVETLQDESFSFTSRRS